MDETLAYVKQRNAFGKPLFAMQNTRFELADCATIATVVHTFEVMKDLIARFL